MDESSSERVNLPDIVTTGDPDFVVMTKDDHSKLVDGKDKEIEQLTSQVISLQQQVL